MSNDIIELQRQINALRRDVERLRAVEGLSLRAAIYTRTLTQAFTINTWYNAIPSNTLTVGAAYIVSFAFDTNGGGEPYYVKALALFCPSITNGTASDYQAELLTSTHTALANPSRVWARAAPASGQVCAGLDVVLVDRGAPAGTILTIEARRLF